MWKSWATEITQQVMHIKRLLKNVDYVKTRLKWTKTRITKKKHTYSRYRKKIYEKESQVSLS